MERSEILRKKDVSCNVQHFLKYFYQLIIINYDYDNWAIL